MNIKQKFEKLSLREITQLYLIVVMSYGLIFIFYKDIYINIYPRITDAAISKGIKNNKPHIKKLSDLELLSYFNKTTQIIINEIKISQNTIEIKMIGDFKNIMNILNNISHDFKMIQFEIKKVDNYIDASIRLERKFFNSEKHSSKKRKEIENPFILSKVKKNYKESKIIISAIVGLEVLVNNHWYKKGDKIKEYLVLLIDNNEVLFLNTKTKKKFLKSILYE